MVSSFQSPLPPNSTQYPHHQHQHHLQRRATILLDQNLDKQQQQQYSSSSSSPKKRKWPDDVLTINKSFHHQTQWRTNEYKKPVMPSSVDNFHRKSSTIMPASDSCKAQLSYVDQTARREVAHDFHFSSPPTRFQNNHIRQQIPNAAATAASHMISLDLALNLQSSSSTPKSSPENFASFNRIPSSKKPIPKQLNSCRRSEVAADDKHDDNISIRSAGGRSTLALFSSSPGFDKRSDRDHQKVVEPQDEMVAAACMRCHMLVMMSKLSPSCPNCKFLHPPDHTLPNLTLKPTLSLSC